MGLFRPYFTIHCRVSAFIARIKTLKAVLDVDKLQQKAFLSQLIVVVSAKALNQVG
jgi:hypothetical protein